ncbi:MAG: UDP-N-acetylmuramoyl-L-alanyl-D-glutamate--2,6-diaminopimelate ligase [Chloroflexota bacterium]|nr:UDP-N-acetylmuramoyl-L-alanyl-D-glutamate--2,6-diaminopimelate ligase [Chloroflexota bacterium]
MRLQDLLQGLPDASVRASNVAGLDITGVSYDSRAVQPGYLFVAIKGAHVDGHRYIPQAIERGAAAIVYQDPAVVTGLEGPVLVAVPDSRVALSPIAAAFYGYPAADLRVAGVTGTKGKTTTATLCAHVLDAAGHTSGLISTADFKIGPRWSENTTRQTTPEALEVQAMLREMVDSGCDYAVIEASSHALSARWNRLGDCQFDIAVFTNVTHEHLDYHGSVEQYRRDKARLFELLHAPSPRASERKRRKVAVANLDDPHAGLYLEAAGPSVDVLTYAVDHPSALVRAIDVVPSPDGVLYTAVTPWGTVEVRLQLPGVFNVHNSLAALAVGLGEGIDPHTCAEALAGVAGVTGRMERVELGQPFTVIVDYAHNPDSFEKVMSMLRPLTSGQLIAVFGSAGERDRQKRPIQGRIAGEYCDLLVITDEDPRDEDREAILEEIAAGARAAGMEEGRGYLKIPDRAAAICAAFERARAGDIVMLLGKGHESCIYYEHERKLPWLERAEAERTLRELGYGSQAVEARTE